jgi:hypothetical protein
MEFLTNTQLNITSKRKKPVSDGSEKEEDKKRKNLQNLLIGLREDDASFEVPDLKRMRDDVQREDGYPPLSDADKANQPFQVDWLDKQDMRRKILEEHPDYKFLDKVAGFSNTTVENFFFNEDVNAEYTRRSLLSSQYQSKEQDAKINLKKLRERKNAKISEINDAESNITSHKKNRRILSEITRYTTALNKWSSISDEKVKYTLMEDLIDIYLSGSAGSSTLMPSITKDALVFLSIRQAKGHVIKNLLNFVSLVLDSFRKEGIVLSVEFTEDEIKKGMDKVDYSEIGFPRRFKAAEKDLSNVTRDEDISTERYLEIIVDCTDFIFYFLRKSDFMLSQKHVNLDGYLNMKENSFRDIKIKNVIATKTSAMDTIYNKLSLEIYDGFLLASIILGDTPTSSIIINEIEGVMVPLSADEETNKSGVFAYLEYLQTFYGYDANLIYDFLADSKSFNLITIRNDFQCVDTITKHLKDFLLERENETQKFTEFSRLKSEVGKNRVKDFLRDCVIIKFDRSHNANNFKKFGTLLLQSELEELVKSLNARKIPLDFNTYTTAYDFAVRIHSEALELEVSKETKVLENLKEEAKALTERIFSIESGAPIKLNEVNFPYKQRRTWVEQAENSGIIRIKPVVMACISAAYNDTQKYTQFSKCDIEAFQVGRISTDFAELVSTHILKRKVVNPGQYYPSGAENSIKMQRLNSINAIRKYYVLSNGKILFKKGEENKNVTFEEPSPFW